MRIVHELLDNDYFVDIFLTEKDIQDILRNVLIIGKLRILQETIHVGVGLTEDMEEEDAAN